MFTPVEPLFVPISDGAKIIGLGRSKFYELVSEKRIPLIKVGRKSLVSVASLKAFADTLTQKAAA